MKTVFALISGLFMGIGLAVSGMIDPAVVQGFLNFGGIPNGTWNPALAGVMGGAIPVAFWLFRLAGEKVPPPSRQISRSLIIGAALFGLGWGLGGICPGPALESWIADPMALIFVVTMLLGLTLAPHLAHWLDSKS